MKPTDLPSIRPMLSMEQVRQLVPLSHCQIYRMMKAGTFPQSIKIGRHRIAWMQSDIAEWIEGHRATSA